MISLMKTHPWAKKVEELKLQHDGSRLGAEVLRYNGGREVQSGFIFGFKDVKGVADMDTASGIGDGVSMEMS
ncbi:unnamed protein product [Camellia sinensis]